MSEEQKEPRQYMDPMLVVRLLANATLADRSNLARYLGRSYMDSTGEFKRDLYSALGYPTTLCFDDYLARYARQDIAKRIVAAPVEEAWQFLPSIVEDEDPKVTTQFEKALEELSKRVNLFDVIERADLLSGIGRFGVIVLGYDDGKESWRQPVEGTRELKFLLPFSEQSVTIEQFVLDGSDPRYNLPELYKISPQTLNNQTDTVSLTGTHEVHWSRVIHLAEGLLEDDVYGEPRLRSVWNRLEDIERISGGSSEMFWRGAFPGMAFNLDPEMVWDESVTDSQGRTPREAQEEEIANFIHGFRRQLRLQGIKAEQFLPQAVSPLDHLDAQFQLISAATGIPKRILTGSERGELASSQDEDAWIRKLNRRRQRYLEPKILRPTIDRLIDHGVLPAPADGYQVNWPDMLTTNGMEQAEIAAKVTEALSKYALSPGIESVVPVEMFLKEVMGFSYEQVDAIADIIKGQMAKENDEIDKDRQAIHEEEAA